jgi:hypothetical protein
MGKLIGPQRLEEYTAFEASKQRESAELHKRQKAQ